MNYSILDEQFNLTKDQINFFEKHRYIKIKNVLNAEVISHFGNLISQKVDELKAISAPLQSRDTYAKAFLQLMNIWTQNEAIKPLVFSKRLGQIATDLLQVNGVRMYHDQALYKEPGGGYTPWHADQYYWPLDSDKTITAWIPLQLTPLSMGPLEFSAGSHQIQEGRDLKIGEESEAFLNQKLRLNDFAHIVEPFDIGEISFHSGWVFHRAGPNSYKEMRKAFTIIYMDQEMKLKKPDNENQINDWKTWCPGAEVGKTINTPLNPILYSK